VSLLALEGHTLLGSSSPFFAVIRHRTGDLVHLARDLECSSGCCGACSVASFDKPQKNR